MSIPKGYEGKHDCRPCCLTHVRIPWVKNAVHIKGSLRVLLWVLAVVHADKDTGKCWPGTATLASETGLSRWSVSRGVEQLVQLGTIEVERQHRKSSRHTVCFQKDPATFRSSVLPIHQRGAGRVGSSVHTVGSSVRRKLVAECGTNRGGGNGVPNGVPPTPPVETNGGEPSAYALGATAPAPPTDETKRPKDPKQRRDSESGQEEACETASTKPTVLLEAFLQVAPEQKRGPASLGPPLTEAQWAGYMARVEPTTTTAAAAVPAEAGGEREWEEETAAKLAGLGVIMHRSKSNEEDLRMGVFSAMATAEKVGAPVYTAACRSCDARFSGHQKPDRCEACSGPVLVTRSQRYRAAA